MLQNLLKFWVPEEFSPLTLHRSKGQGALIIKQSTVSELRVTPACIYTGGRVPRWGEELQVGVWALPVPPVPFWSRQPPLSVLQVPDQIQDQPSFTSLTFQPAETASPENWASPTNEAASYRR